MERAGRSGYPEDHSAGYETKNNVPIPGALQ